MQPLEFFAGVDWSSKEHQVCVLDLEGKVCGQRGFAHCGKGLHEMIDWIVNTTCQLSLKNDPPLSLKNDPPLLGPTLGSGQAKIPKFQPPFSVPSGAIPEAPALVAGLNNFAVMRQPIQQRRGHLLISKHRRPFPK